MSSVYASIVDKLRPNGELDDSWYKNSGNVLKFGKANDVEKRHKKEDEILFKFEFACEADALYAEQKILEALRKDYEPYASKKEHFIVEVSERHAFLKLVRKMAIKIKWHLEVMVGLMKVDDEVRAEIRAGGAAAAAAKFVDYVELSVVRYMRLASRTRVEGAVSAVCKKWEALVGHGRWWASAAAAQ
jgi:hypothetical protein